MMVQRTSSDVAVVANHQASHMARQKALADAFAGVLASLVSLWAFYPVDVYKTHLQATHHDDSDWSTCPSSCSASTSSPPTKSKSTALSVSDLLHFFRGWHIKSWHTIASNFCYFYLESWMTSRWIKFRRRQRNQQDDNQGNKKKKSLSPLEHLIVSALAAMLNTCLTLPLDVISLKSQAPVTRQNDNDNEKKDVPIIKQTTEFSPDDSSHSPSKYIKSDAPPISPTHVLQQMDNVWNSFQQRDDQSTSDAFFDCSSNSDATSSAAEEEKKDDRLSPSSDPILNHTSSLPTNDFTVAASNTTTSPCFHRYNNTRLLQLLSLWKGLVPSLLLCSNPSIHYTVYDLIKNYLLSRPNSSGSSQPRHKLATHLTWAESFGTGVVAKLIATLITYPLIRAKVLLIMKNTPTSTTSKPNTKRTDVAITPGETVASTDCINACSSGSSNSDSLVQCLLEQYRQYGLAGWYRGCSIQILHTVLKSALIMMLREQITDLVHAWLIHRPHPLREKT